MIFGASDELEKVVTEEDACDFAKASYDPSLSAVGNDEAQATFWATLDKVQFQKAVAVVSKVLEANGYVVNLENILACLDSLVFATRVRLSSKPSDSGKPRVKTYGNCIQFSLPAKHKVGELLKKFYEEIEAYEAEIAQLQGSRVKLKPGEKDQTPEEMRQEIRKLRAENESLRQSLADTSARLASYQRSHADYSKALEAQNLLPEGLRVATVRSVDLGDKTLVLKTGRTTFHVPLGVVEAVPEAGDQCLVKIEGGHVKGLFLFEKPGRPFTLKLGKVLFVDGEVVKLRDSDRRTWRIKAPLGPDGTPAKLRRGDVLGLSMFDEQIIKAAKLGQGDELRFVARIQDALATLQIGAAYFETTTAVDEQEDKHVA